MQVLLERQLLFLAKNLLALPDILLTIERPLTGNLVWLERTVGKDFLL